MTTVTSKENSNLYLAIYYNRLSSFQCVGLAPDSYRDGGVMDMRVEASLPAGRQVWALIFLPARLTPVGRGSFCVKTKRTNNKEKDKY